MAIYSNQVDPTKSRYTHRDYESIKEDLINVIPSLTQEWTSREDSDPGIVLVKLMSIFGDMMSFNIDKIALELYIQSVTQRKNCAKILELLGYKMHWYRSARVMAYVKLANTEDTEHNLIHFLITPMKAMFKADGDLTYCVAMQSKGNTDQIDIYSSTEMVPVKLIQGKPQTITFSKTDLINNRFYLSTLKVDESEFNLTVSNAGRRVNCELIDRLYLASDRSKMFYEFNIDEYDRPYIQLDEGWEDLVNSDNPSFTLQYIVTDGSNGNVSSNAFKSVVNSDEGSISYTNLVVDNFDNTSKYDSIGRLDGYNSPGYDPQTVQEARVDSSNYVFTHDTLVTSYDYEKAAKRVDDITVSKLVDAQVIINDHLDLEELCKRANDNFSYGVEGLISTEVESDSSNILAYVEIPEIKEPSYGQYFKIKFNHDFGINNTSNPPGLLVLNRSLSQNNYYQEYVYPIYKLVNSMVIQEGKEYILYYNPTVTYYTKPGDSDPTEYNGRWDLYDNASQVTKDHEYLSHHTVILYLGYKDFDYYSNFYYNSVQSSSEDYPWRLYGSDPYGIEYTDQGSMVNKEDAGYYPYKPLNNILQSVRELINDLHVLDVTVEFGTIKLFPFKVKGIVHLLEPMSPEEVYQIYLIIGNALRLSYYPDRHPVGEKPNFIEIVDIIQNSDSRIKYFDAIDNIVEWAPAINTDPESEKYIDKIFDTTSAIRYNGLSDEFNFAKKFMTFKLRNGSAPNFGIRQIKYGTEGQESNINTEEGHTAYLFNYSRLLPGYKDDRDVIEIGYTATITLEIENIKQLEALCKDLKFKGPWIQSLIVYEGGLPATDQYGNYIYETKTKWIDNTGIHWQE